MIGAILATVASIGTTVAGVLHSAATVVMGVASHIGPAVATFSQRMLGLIDKIPKIDWEGVCKVLDLAANIVDGLMRIIGEGTVDDAEELGAKAMYSEKTVEDFDGDVEAYINYLQNEIEFDKKDFERMSREEKTACAVIGIGLETAVLEKKLGGMELSPEFITLLGRLEYGGKLVLDTQELFHLILDMKEAGITNMKDVSDLLEGVSGQSDRIHTRSVLKESLGNIDTVENPNSIISDWEDVLRTPEMNED